MDERIRKIIAQFALPGGEIEAAPYGNGHINDTLRVIVHADGGDRRYILQRVNSYVFPKPVEVIENIEKVTAYLRLPFIVYDAAIVVGFALMSVYSVIKLVNRIKGLLRPGDGQSGE